MTDSEYKHYSNEKPKTIHVLIALRRYAEPLAGIIRSCENKTPQPTAQPVPGVLAAAFPSHERQQRKEKRQGMEKVIPGRHKGISFQQVMSRFASTMGTEQVPGEVLLTLVNPEARS
jgi:hypothetical protein